VRELSQLKTIVNQFNTTHYLRLTHENSSSMGTSLWQPPDDKKTTLAAGMLSALGIFLCSVLYFETRCFP
jgi:hypothetical protein